MTVRQILSDVPVYTVKSVPYTLGDGSFHTGADTPFFVLLIDIAPLPDRYSICNVDCSLTRRKPLVKSFFEFLFETLLCLSLSRDDNEYSITVTPCRQANFVNFSKL